MDRQELENRKKELKDIMERFVNHFREATVKHEEHVHRSFVAVTDGTLSLINKKEKVTATYRRSLNSDIQLHRKITLRGLYFLKMRYRFLQEELDKVNSQLQKMEPLSRDEKLESPEDSPAA